MPHDSAATALRRELKLQGRDGQPLAAEAAGDPRSVPVILLHGGGQTRHAWSGTALRLAEAGYYALAYDARGHGDSAWSHDGDYSPDALIGDLRAVASTLRSPPVLVGASMGGLTSMVALGEAAEGFARALVLVDIAARLEKAALAKLRTLREALAGSPDVAREIYLTIFPGGLRFRPTKGSDWEIMGVLETGKLLPIEHTSCSDPTGNRALVRPRQVCVRPRLYAHPA